ncbi:hypothetical protein IW140_003401 [Coemansia sp. RSA 1813]|nr:hypothetical protein EV178_003218 [Coemansia sp. RSA 1646]KAJ1771026.1 hypothetical protein LPJ74_002717 [Coemansia sp. RSA 1843]KAJ2089265.1 hypothetical protein IW138_003585 [Coemansia sp. RSA 986]KAJ2215094.1 hypothetical protein EV179_002462 [Coemansia sp. RSA 487]KAJ2569036.1 hypothetical protein IW140_003401 [Coemansia sp. RSA 1813]
MSFVAACCNTPPVQADYKSEGETVKKGDVEYYFAGEKGAKQGVVFCYDIFGFHPNSLQVADILGRSGFRVIMPDFLRGDPITAEKMNDGKWISEFKANKAGWEHNRAMFTAAVEILRAEGVESIGAIGFCWGAKLAIRGLAESGESGAGVIKSGALIHPSMLEKEDFEEAAGPILLLPTKDEADFTEFFAIAKAKPFGEASYQERFNNQTHGFCAARGDFSKPEVVSDVNKAIQLTVGFFKKTLA